LEWLDFMGFLRVAYEARQEEERASLIAASFTSWQIIETLKAMFIDKNKETSFLDYISHFGLAEKTAEKKMTADEALKQAAAIVAAAKKEAGQNGNGSL
jgi:hypothetical protein